MSFLEYRPRLEYKKELQAILQEQEEYNDLGHDLTEPDAVSRSEKFMSQRLSYRPSSAVLEALDVLPTDILVGLSDAIQKVDTFIDKIVDNLKSEVTNPIPISEYIKAREENLLPSVYAFEDYHQDSIEGNTAAELLPMFFRLQEELGALSSFALPHLYPDALSHDLEYLMRHLSQLEKAEQDGYVRPMIEKDKAQELDVEELKEKNHILYFLYEYIQNVLGFVEEAEATLKLTMQTIYSDAGESVLELLRGQSDLAERFAELNLHEFEHQASYARDAQERIGRLTTPEYKTSLLQKTIEYQTKKLRHRQTSALMEAINPEDEGNPVNLVLLDMLDNMERIVQVAETLVMDLYKVNRLESMQMEDYLVSIQKKHQARLLHKGFQSITG